MAWNRAESSLPGGNAAVQRMNVAGRRRETERARLFAERGWRELHEWDLEELGRMQARNEDGTWPRGPRPEWLSPFVREEIRRRFAEEGERQIWMVIPAAIGVLAEVIRDPNADPALRVKAATYVIDQGLGRATQRVEAEVVTSATQFLADRVVLEDGQDAHPVVSGEVVDDETDSEGGSDGS